MTKNRIFAHRFNADGTVDSICRECFSTVATAGRESELAVKEQAHSCDPQMVEWYRRPVRELSLAVGTSSFSWATTEG